MTMYVAQDSSAKIMRARSVATRIEDTAQAFQLQEDDNEDVKGAQQDSETSRVASIEKARLRF